MATNNWLSGFPAAFGGMNSQTNPMSMTNPAYGVSGGYAGPNGGAASMTPGFQMEGSGMAGGAGNGWTQPAGAGSMGGATGGYGGGDWKQLLGGGSQGSSPYSFIPGVNDYGAKLSADQGISKITGMDPNQVEQMASGHGLDYWQQQQSGMPSGGSYGQMMPGAAPAGGGYGLSANPFQGGQADAIRGQQSQLFGDMNNQIRSGAIATGGYGGSRMGVAQGVAMGRAATGLDSSLANTYSNNWNQDQSRGLQQYLGDQSFYNQGRALDQSGAQVGANIYNLGQQGQWGPYQNFANTMNPFTGFGSASDTKQQGGGGIGMLGGALGGAQLFNLWDNPNSTSTSTNPWAFLNGGK